MKISEMINELKEIMNDNGDIEVVMKEHAGDFDMDQDTFVYGVKIENFVENDNKKYLVVGQNYEADVFSYDPYHSFDLEDVVDKIKEFIGSTYFGTHDTMEFVCRYMDCDTERDREMVHRDMINFYTGKFEKEVDELLDLVDDAWVEGYSFEEIKEQLKD